MAVYGFGWADETLFPNGPFLSYPITYFETKTLSGLPSSIFSTIALFNLFAKVIAFVAFLNKF